MDNVLEQQRKLHEEKERIEDALVKERMLKKNSVKEQINCDQRVRVLVERSVQCAVKLLGFYEDQDNLRQEEMGALSGPDEFAEFYKRLKLLKDHHRKYPNDTEEPMDMEFLRLDHERKNPTDDTQNLVQFTDEEGYGRFLDLHEVYDMFVNLKQISKMDYLTYLLKFDHLHEITKEKKNMEYRKYITKLLDYLSNYLERSQPLLDQNLLYHEIQADFEEKWTQGNFPGWKKDTGSAITHMGAPLDLTAFSSPEELMSLGLDRLKSALVAMGLKCGGNLKQRADRLYSVKGIPQESIDPSLMSKSKLQSRNKEFEAQQKELALIEAQIYKYAEIFSEQKQATRENVERKMARTADELLQEEEEEEIQEEPESESEDEDGVPYNPKNLPLGWDGKPIPYWLYKLHGLNISYNCEICGNATYRGPKAFQRHFSEWRHAHGMRCLGIPNTAHFANVTLIADALALWEKIKDNKARERWLAANEEEFEDTIGNVVNKKTFEDLKRQGLL